MMSSIILVKLVVCYLCTCDLMFPVMVSLYTQLNRLYKADNFPIITQGTGLYHLPYIHWVRKKVTYHSPGTWCHQRRRNIKSLNTINNNKMNMWSLSNNKTLRKDTIWVVLPYLVNYSMVYQTQRLWSADDHRYLDGGDLLSGRMNQGEEERHLKSSWDSKRWFQDTSTMHCQLY
jgi:hypothetical protein